MGAIRGRRLKRDPATVRDRPPPEQFYFTTFEMDDIKILQVRASSNSVVNDISKVIKAIFFYVRAASNRFELFNK